MIARGKKAAGERYRVWHGQVHTAVFKMDNQHGPAVWHRELAQDCVAARMGGESGGHESLYLFHNTVYVFCLCSFRAYLVATPW